MRGAVGSMSKRSGTFSILCVILPLFLNFSNAESALRYSFRCWDTPPAKTAPCHEPLESTALPMKFISVLAVNSHDCIATKLLSLASSVIDFAFSILFSKPFIFRRAS